MAASASEIAALVTCLAWHVWCELIGELLYELLLVLPDAERTAMEAGFDAEHRRLFPDFYFE